MDVEQLWARVEEIRLRLHRADKVGDSVGLGISASHQGRESPCTLARKRVQLSPLRPMQHFLRIGWALVALAVHAWPAELPFEEGALRRLTAVTQGDTPGIAVLIAREGKIAFQGGFGLADLELKTPITTDTKFRIGSITKQFTAAAVVRLAEAGKLSLADSLAKYLPDFPRGAEVTLLQLITHTSGIHSYTEKPGFFARVRVPIEPHELIAWFRDDPPDFPPGAGFRYNNSAYFLLGEIVAQVSGKSFAAYLHDTFFEPLGMKDTGIYVNRSPPAGMARGYSYLEGKFAPALDWDMSWAGGAGALYSTVGDLFRWNEALFGGRVLNPDSFKAAITPVQLPPGIDGMSYGYGLMVFEEKRLPAIGHGGGLNGWSSDLLRFPEQHCTVVVLGNALPPAPRLVPGEIGRALAEKLLAAEIAAVPPPAEDTSVDPKSFEAFTGRYVYPNGIMTVTLDDNALYTQITGQPRFRMYARSADTFFLKVVAAQFAFVRDEQGRVVSVRHTQGGNTFTARRQPEPEVKLTATQVDAFVGRYRYGEKSIMTITRDDTQLFAQLTDQPKWPIFPISDSEFEWRIVKAKVQFVRDADGSVTKAIHTQNGRSFDAPVIE